VAITGIKCMEIPKKNNKNTSYLDELRPIFLIFSENSMVTFEYF